MKKGLCLLIMSYEKDVVIKSDNTIVVKGNVKGRVDTARKK